MAIEIEKPQPLMIGDKAYYTLTSYEPVTVEVEVPMTTDEDVALMLDSAVIDAGGSAESLADGAWLEKHFGSSDLAEVRAAARDRITNMNAEMAEQQKLGRCVDELRKRLVQAVPAMHVTRARAMVEAQFAARLEADGVTIDQFLARSGTRADDLQASFDAQAQAVAESDAALDAFAHERKLKMDDGEIPRLLRIPAAEAQRVVEQAKAAGQLSELRDVALRNKATELLVAECACTYRHETAEEAEGRVAQMRALREQLAEAGKARPKGDADEQGAGTSDGAGLHLV